jgi:hypothetical protein
MSSDLIQHAFLNLTLKVNSVSKKKNLQKYTTEKSYDRIYSSNTRYRTVSISEDEKNLVKSNLVALKFEIVSLLTAKPKIIFDCSNSIESISSEHHQFPPCDADLSWLVLSI